MVICDIPSFHVTSHTLDHSLIPMTGSVEWMGKPGVQVPNVVRRVGKSPWLPDDIPSFHVTWRRVCIAHRCPIAYKGTGHLQQLRSC